VPVNTPNPMADSIPKRIIQTGKSRDLPLVAQASAAGIRALNPDFDYLFFDDVDVENFIDRHFPQHRQLFDSFPYRIQKYDFFRYLAVYLHGGFYFDLDIFLARGLDDLCVHSCVFPFEELSLHSFLRESHGMDWEVGNYAFGAAPGHPFIAAIIENCVRAQRESDWPRAMWKPIPALFRKEFYVLDTTGPGLVSRTLAEFRAAASQVHVLFPSDVCDKRHWHQFGDYGVHMQEGGWRSQKSLWRRKLGSMWESRTRAALLKESQARGPTRSLEFHRPA
jgi:inositol phosphorylceramide mannosyltransferase catalytic subunit